LSIFSSNSCWACR
jgi:hypothetical protein